jgi:hypothetical protein
MPRYNNLRDYTRTQVEGRKPHWYTAPLRWYAGRGRDVALDPPASTWLDVPSAFPSSAGSPSTPDPVPSEGGISGGDFSAAPTFGGGGGGVDPSQAAAAFLGVGGGGPDLSSVLPGSDFASGTFGGGGSLAPDAGGLAGGGAGGDVDVDLGDGFMAALVVIGAVLAVAAAAVLLWFVLLPALLIVIDGTVLVVVVLLAGVVRVLFRRPWDVVATLERPDGDETWRWELRGFHRAGRVRDVVARAFETGTDPDLAVTRVLVEDPWDGDRPGGGRSVRELRVR